MARYDPEIMFEFANRLYSTAKTITVAYTFLGALIGGASGYAVGYAVEQWQPSSGQGTMEVIMVSLAVVFCLRGFFIGREKAFRLKLQAQTALCQVKIEENTRKQ